MPRTASGHHVFSLYMQNDLRERIEKVALQEHRTISNLISHILIEYLEKNGNDRLPGGD